MGGNQVPHKRRKRSISKSLGCDRENVDEGEECVVEEEEERVFVDMSEEESEGDDLNFLECCDTCGELLSIPHGGWERCSLCTTLYCTLCKTKEP